MHWWAATTCYGQTSNISHYTSRTLLKPLSILIHKPPNTWPIKPPKNNEELLSYRLVSTLKVLNAFKATFPSIGIATTKLKFLPCYWLLPKKLGWPWIHWSGIPGMWFAHIWVGLKCLLGNIRQCLWTNGEDKDSRYLLWWGFYSRQFDTVSREMWRQFWLLKFGRWYVQVGFRLGYSLF